jgi:hypothetical protein
MMTRAIDEAVELLRDSNLVWSADLEGIRFALADLLLVSAAQGDIMETLADNLAKKILSWESEEIDLASYRLDLERR